MQGNIDPALLQAPWPVLEAHVRDVVERGRAAPAHVLNLGHGVQPDTDPDVLPASSSSPHAVTAGTSRASPAPARPRVPDAVVVGGGIAGLVVARDLGRGRACASSLLEASDRLGGEVLAAHGRRHRPRRRGRELRDPRRHGRSAGHASSASATTSSLPDPRGAWVQRGRRHAFPLPKTGLLGIPGDADRRRRHRRRRRPPPCARGRALDAPAARRSAPTRRSSARSSARRMGDAVLDRLVTPVVSGVHSLHPDDLDVDRVAPGLRAALAPRGLASPRAVLGPARARPGRLGRRRASAAASCRLVDALVADLERARRRRPARRPRPLASTRPASTLAGGERVAADDGRARRRRPRRAWP